jgi:uncharacterized heparinase superfamily protein
MAPERMGDDVVATLRELCRTLEQNEERARTLLDKGSALAGRRDEGQSWIDLTESEDGRRTVELLSDAAEALMRANAAFRRALAKALYTDGATLTHIGEVLGVSRQRVAFLLASEQESAAEEA